jgi:hypothetical protein
MTFGDGSTRLRRGELARQACIGYFGPGFIENDGAIHAVEKGFLEKDGIEQHPRVEVERLSTKAGRGNRALDCAQGKKEKAMRLKVIGRRPQRRPFLLELNRSKKLEGRFGYYDGAPTKTKYRVIPASK